MAAFSVKARYTFSGDALMTLCKETLFDIKFDFDHTKMAVNFELGGVYMRQIRCNVRQSSSIAATTKIFYPIITLTLFK